MTSNSIGPWDSRGPNRWKRRIRSPEPEPFGMGSILAFRVANRPVALVDYRDRRREPFLEVARLALGPPEPFAGSNASVKATGKAFFGTRFSLKLILSCFAARATPQI